MSAETNKNKYISIQDAEPFRMLFTPQRDPGFPLSRGQNWSPFDMFSLSFFLAILLIVLLRLVEFLQKLSASLSESLS